MALLDNPRQEAFALHVAKGMSGRDAYMAAGYNVKSPEVADAAAARLLGNVKVAARVAELQERSAGKTETTVATVLEMLWSIAKDAQKAEDFGAASISMERVAKVAGIWVEKSQSQTDVTQRTVTDLSEAEWRSKHLPEPLSQSLN